MKRTKEIAYTSIGLAFNLLIIITIAVLLNSSEEFEHVFAGIGLDFFIILFIGAFLSIGAIYFFAGNKHPKVASGLTILAALTLVLGLFLFGIIPAIFYMISGVMGLVRKRPFSDPFEDVKA